MTNCEALRSLTSQWDSFIHTMTSKIDLLSQFTSHLTRMSSYTEYETFLQQWVAETNDFDKILSIYDEVKEGVLEYYNLPYFYLPPSKLVAYGSSIICFGDYYLNFYYAHDSKIIQRMMDFKSYIDRRAYRGKMLCHGAKNTSFCYSYQFFNDPHDRISYVNGCGVVEVETDTKEMCEKKWIGNSSNMYGSKFKRICCESYCNKLEEDKYIDNDIQAPQNVQIETTTTATTTVASVAVSCSYYLPIVLCALLK